MLRVPRRVCGEHGLARSIGRRVVHGYWDVDLQILHDTASEGLPAMIQRLHDVLHELFDVNQDPAGGPGPSES